VGIDLDCGRFTIDGDLKGMCSGGELIPMQIKCGRFLSVDSYIDVIVHVGGGFFLTRAVIIDLTDIQFYPYLVPVPTKGRCCGAQDLIII